MLCVFDLILLGTFGLNCEGNTKKNDITNNEGCFKLR
jgi:hypothetical protein